MCPDCRFVFRVPRDHDGTGLVCPCCRRLLKLPAPGEALPPLVLETPAPAQSAETEPPPGTVAVRRRHRGNKVAGPAWEQESRKQRSKHLNHWIVAGVADIIIGVAAVTATILHQRPAVADAIPGTQPVPDAPTVVQPTLPPPKAGRIEEFNAAEFQKTAETMARSFLAAKDISEVLPLIRHPEISAPRLKQVWPDGHLQSPGLEVFAENGEIGFLSGTATVSVRTSDFQSRLLRFVKTDSGWKIDWESWADWSEVSWADFVAKKPVTPQRFRVRASVSAYYNFNFSDENKWRCYLLQSVDGEHQVYGYAETGSAQNDRMRLNGDLHDSPMMLDIHFPADSGSANQVLIDRIVADDWVEPEEAPKP